MKILDTIGIDMSKLTFDVRIHSSQAYVQFKNSKTDFKELLKWSFKNSAFSKENILFIFEHTGLYSHQLAVYLTEQKVPFALVPGLEIKRSLGIARGKDDKVDATKIALYGYRLRDELNPYKLPTTQVLSIKRLLSLRERLVKQRAGFKASFKEQKRVLILNKNKTLFDVQEKMIAYLTKQINDVEKQMITLIKCDDKLKKQYELITSIKGLGMQSTLFIIAYTSGFTKFKNARKFASYIGIAPFPNTSGTSLIGRTKVSHLANKKIKSLLDMCSKSAIQHNPEMKKYYEKRVAEGKNKMSTLNIIRNKLVARIFAVVERGSIILI